MENASGIAIFKCLQYGQGKMRPHLEFLQHFKIIYSCFGQGLQILSFDSHFLDAKYLYNTFDISTSSLSKFSVTLLNQI